MPHDPKLEVFKIQIKAKEKKKDITFKDFFLEIFVDEEARNPEPKPNSIFLDFFKGFINLADKEKYIINDKQKKAFTTYDVKPKPGEKPSVEPLPSKRIIHGVIEGGKYGLSRRLSSIENKNVDGKVDPLNVIADKFYFLLYTPFNSDTGILIIQSYTGETITSVFNEFLAQKVLSGSDSFQTTKIVKYYPAEFVNQFKTGFIVKQFTYTTKEKLTYYSDETHEEKTEDFDIRIVASTKKNAITEKAMTAIRAKLESVKLLGKRLSEYDKKAKIESKKSGNSVIFKIDEEDSIKPIIFLDGLVDTDIDGRVKLASLEKYCLELLDILKTEIYQS